MRYMIVATAVTVVLLGLLFIILLGILIKKGKFKVFVYRKMLFSSNIQSYINFYI